MSINLDDIKYCISSKTPLSSLGDLEGVDLRGANLEGAYLEGAIGLKDQNGI
jgi:uncharacterized protein YjbI with pentapeptide repeats